MNDTDSQIYYHYTSVESALNIIQSGTIWCTDWRYLNDANESIIGESLLMKYFKSRKLDLKLFKRWVDLLATNVFVFCLSASPRILSQWRSYADDGRGVVLGFTEDRFSSTSTVECIYDESRSNSIVEQFINDNHEALERANTLFGGNVKKVAAETRKLFLSIKHEAYSDEREIRLLFQQGHDSQDHLFRARNGLVIPYIESALRPNSENRNTFIDELWIGPRCDGRNADVLSRLSGVEVQKYDCGYIG